MLGVVPGVSARQLRHAFLREVRAHHPDTTERPHGAGERTATVVAAYRLLRALPAGAPEAPDATLASERRPAPPVSEGATIEVIADEAIWVGVDAQLVAPVLLDVADELGEVSYVDRPAGLVQLTVRPPAGPTCWLTVSTHGRPGGTVLVATLESIEALPTPPAGPLVLALAQALARHLTA